MDSRRTAIRITATCLLQLFRKEAEKMLSQDEEDELCTLLKYLTIGTLYVPPEQQELVLRYWAEFLTLEVINDRTLRRGIKPGCDRLFGWPPGVTSRFFALLGGRVELITFLRTECPSLPLHLSHDDKEPCGWLVDIVISGPDKHF